MCEKHKLRLLEWLSIKHSMDKMCLKFEGHLCKGNCEFHSCSLSGQSQIPQALDAWEDAGPEKDFLHRHFQDANSHSGLEGLYAQHQAAMLSMSRQDLASWLHCPDERPAHLPGRDAWNKICNAHPGLKLFQLECQTGCLTIVASSGVQHAALDEAALFRP